MEIQSWARQKENPSTSFEDTETVSYGFSTAPGLFDIMHSIVRSSIGLGGTLGQLVRAEWRHQIDDWRLPGGLVDTCVGGGDRSRFMED